ncbi:uncharacterized protein LOC125682288 [Ostrea edulis]|uniref:uncharacterized protein LOC125682288 n=1 Tax=Ostrea edulis TaxID=37623 RepID=UPI0024AEBBA5|nr:uncharacterized protein LOC125682288 [Ostrea edulis]
MYSKFILEITFIIIHISGLISGQCNLDGVRNCMANVSMPDQITQDLKSACDAYKTVESCLAPYQGSCESDPMYQEMVSGFSAIDGFCVGDASCDPTRCYSIIGIDITGSNQPPQDNCVKYPEFKGCVDSQRPACEGNIMFQMLDEAFNQLTMACTGGGNPGINGKNCDVRGFEICLKEAGFQLKNVKGMEYGCDVVSTTMACVAKYESGCANQSLFNFTVSPIKKLHEACKLVCKIGGCLDGISLPIYNCTDIENSIMCLDTKLKECPSDPVLKTTLDGLKNLCSEISQKAGMKAYRICLSNSTINEECQKHLMSPTESETEGAECQRIDEFSKCVKMALPNCNNDEVKEYVSENARKLISLKTKRKGGIDCSTSDGALFIPQLSMFLFAVLTWAIISI